LKAKELEHRLEKDGFSKEYSEKF